MDGRNRLLDGLRGVAIILVICQHIVTHRWTTASLSPRWLLEHLTSLGRTGVDLFFVLSGFLLTGILLDHGREPGAVKTFYIRRVCRILPLYSVVLVGVLALLWANGRFHWHMQTSDAPPVWSCLTFTQNFVMGARDSWFSSPLTPTWSLAAEEQFYLLLPITVLFTTRKQLMATALTVLAAGFLCRWCWGNGVREEAMLPWRADGLMVGVILALIVRDPEKLAWFEKHRSRAVVAAGVLAAGWLATSLDWTTMGPLRLTWVAAFFGVLVLLAATSEGTSRAARLLASEPFVWIGTISYGIYLMHIAFLLIAFHLVFGTAFSVLTVPDALLTLSALLVTVFVADVSFRYFEKPIIEFGHRFRYAERPSVLPTRRV